MSTDYCLAIFIAVFSLTITTTISAPFTEEPKHISFRDHLARVNGFKCGNPQDRSYRIKKILPPGELATNEVIYPIHTVIRICDQGAGCCDDESKTCGPAVDDGFEYEEAKVRVSEILGGKNSSIRILKIKHHKKCECRLRSEYTPSEPSITLLA